MKEGRGGQPPPPPEDKAARWGGSGERVRDGPHDRARRKHAPCRPQRGGHRGCERWVGRATTGATRQAPPPPPCRGTSAAPRACAVLATCLRQRTGSEGAPPPTPFSPTHPGKGRGQRGGGEGTWGGGGQRTDRRTRGRDGRRAVETQKKKRKENKEQSKPTRQGKKARRQGPKPRRTGGGRGDMGPQGTLGKNPTSGVWGPQRGTPPPPLQPRPVLASCLRRACDMRATKGRRQGRQGG